MDLNALASSAGEVDETSPDMLRNTPSNIRRLANEIEQCEGRQKYLAHTASPSDGGDVRWYFCKVPLAENEMAASIPRTEIVGKSDYFRFGMRDSLAIEASFLQREDELLSVWWKEYAECSEGPRGQPSTSSKARLQPRQFSLESLESGQSNTNEEERVGVPVKGGLYEVDLVKRHCFPVYWNGENRRVLRGHWFARKGGLDWLPLREDVSEQLEYAYRSQVWHRRTFQMSGLFAARVDLQGSNPGLHALFTGEDDTWEAWLNVDASGFSSVVNFGENTIKLRRGYSPSQSKKPTKDDIRQQREEEMDDYCSQVPVRHLVFMVHGIGQRLEKSNLVDDVGEFRQVTASVAERHLTSYQLGTQRVLYIPCQWRKGLQLGGEAAVDKITLDGVRGLRTMLSATVHDVLYYMSPIYCQTIIDSVSNQLNKLYLKFLRRNPGYDGKVSVYGHSLGSVLSYDILCHQENLYSPFPMEWMFKGQSSEASPEDSVNLQTESKVEPDNSNLVDGPEEGTCNPLGPPASSESDESISDISCQQTDGASGFDRSAIESIDVLNQMELYTNEMTSDNTMNSEIGPSDDDKNKKDIAEDKDGSAKETIEVLNQVELYRNEMTGDHNSMNSEVGPSDDDKNKSDITEDKDEEIRSLREEIDMLKAKLEKFDAEYACKGLMVDAKSCTGLANQPDPESVQSANGDSLKSYTPQIRYTKLEFKVDTFFAVGSPLGVFLSLRNVRIGIGKGKEYWEEENIHEEMPACRQMFNIFHPFDPVAYRIEPLVCKEFIHKRPVIIPYHRGGKRLYVGFQEFKEGLASHSQAMMSQLNTVKVKVLTICESRSNDRQDEEFEDHQVKEERSYGSLMIERLTGSKDGRVDHVLQDKTFRHPYISALGSHTNYWRDHDTALFMLKHLYRDISEEPESPTGGHDGSSTDKRVANNSWSDPREVADEELPLTFADTVFIKNFSHKAKKVMKQR